MERKSDALSNLRRFLQDPILKDPSAAELILNILPPAFVEVLNQSGASTSTVYESFKTLVAFGKALHSHDVDDDKTTGSPLELVFVGSSGNTAFYKPDDVDTSDTFVAVRLRPEPLINRNTRKRPRTKIAKPTVDPSDLFVGLRRPIEGDLKFHQESDFPSNDLNQYVILCCSYLVQRTLYAVPPPDNYIYFGPNLTDKRPQDTPLTSRLQKHLDLHGTEIFSKSNPLGYYLPQRAKLHSNTTTGFEYAMFQCGEDN